MNHPRSSGWLAALKLTGMLVTAIIFVAGVPVALSWAWELLPLLLALLIPVAALSIALGLWRRRW